MQTPNATLTSHARARMQQRGIGPCSSGDFPREPRYPIPSTVLTPLSRMSVLNGLVR